MTDQQKVVLVVEDEALVRMMLIDVLTDEGFLVIEAPNGREALEMLPSLAALDALVTDLKMPFVGGLEVAQAARQRWPELPIIIASGSLDAKDVADAVRGSHYLPKPFSPGLLTTQLVRMISHPRVG